MAAAALLAGPLMVQATPSSGSGNPHEDGPGSGLDADYLDGVDSSQFLRNDVDGTMLARLSLGAPPLPFNGVDDYNFRVRGNTMVRGESMVFEPAEVSDAQAVRILHDGTKGMVFTSNIDSVYNPSPLYLGTQTSPVMSGMQIETDGRVVVGTGTTQGMPDPLAGLHLSHVGSMDSFRVDDQLGDTTPFVVGPDGNVGVGTSSPSQELDVVGSGTLVHLQDSTQPNRPVLQLGIDADGASFIRANSYGNAPSDDLRLATHENGVNRDAVLIKGNGNVGIGTQNPEYKVDLQGSPGGSLMRLQGGPGQGAGITMGSSGDSQWVMGPGVSDLWNAQMFGIGTGEGRGSTKIVVTTEGNVGIGTIGRPDGDRLPAAKLDVAGDVRISGDGNGITFPDGSRQTTAASAPLASVAVQVLEEDFDNTYLPSSLWEVSSVGNGRIVFDNLPGTIRMDTSSTSGGDAVTLRSTKQFSVEEGTLVFRAMLDAYRDHAIYGNRQPRGLAAGVDRNNAIEFTSASGTAVACRTVSGGVATETVVDIGQSVYEVASYQIVAGPDEVRFYVNGLLSATHTTNIPHAPLNLLFSTTDGGAGTTPIDLYSTSFEILR